MSNRGLLFTATERERLRRGISPGGFEFHETIGSTNDRAAELAAQPQLACPYVVLAETQTDGRGRGSNRWWSAPGALTFSVVIDARTSGLAVERWPLVALATGLAVCEALERMAPESHPRVKWPNDVYVAGKKVGGILVEAPALASGRLIVGIGVNVNNGFVAAPTEFAASGISLADVTGRREDRAALLLDLGDRLAAGIALLAGNQQELLRRWRSFCLLTGKHVRLIAGSRQVVGVCRGIDDSGRLVVATSSGPASYASGTIESFE